MGFFYRVVIDGVHLGQAVKNVLWYEEVNDLIANVSDAIAFREEVGIAVALLLGPSYDFLTDSYMADTVSVNVYDNTGGKRDVSPLEVPVSIAGTAVAEANGAGDYVVLALQLDLGVVEGFPPTKGYVAFGPMPETRIVANGAHNFNGVERSLIANPFSVQLLPAVSPAPPTQWELDPIRVRRSLLPGPPQILGRARVASAIMRPIVSSRRSRRFPTKGAL